MDAGGRPGCQAPGGKSGGLGLSTGTAGTGGGCGVRSRCGEDGAEAGITGEAEATTGPRFPSGGGRACVCSGLDNRRWGALPKPSRGARGEQRSASACPARSLLQGHVYWQKQAVKCMVRHGRSLGSHACPRYDADTAFRARPSARVSLLSSGRWRAAPL